MTGEKSDVSAGASISGTLSRLIPTEPSGRDLGSEQVSNHPKMSSTCHDENNDVFQNEDYRSSDF